MEQRLQKILAAAGVGSRRHCEVLITTGRVTVNGELITQLGAKADPDRDEISLDGKPIEPGQDKLYVLLNKPTGYTSTRFDRFAKNTVMELVDTIGTYLYPVGRLDVDTSGLMVLTNDGDFAQLIMHPSHQIEKTYVAEVHGKINAEALNALERGIELDDGPTAPAKVHLISYSPETDISKVELIIHEGRKRQVRRMLAAVGHRVVKLARVRLGDLDLKGVPEGQYRFLTQKEVSRLKKLATPKTTKKDPGAR
ncbi:MAG: pseudouridine synthase [Armatimonadota bacterium]|nr:rRNA pseudouridine synthase [bacterium]